jgi:hypothetical protein
VKLILLLISYKYNRWLKISSLSQLCRKTMLTLKQQHEKKFSQSKQQQNDFRLFPRREICILKTLENLSIKKNALLLNRIEIPALMCEHVTPG